MQHLGLVTRRELHRRFGLMLPDRALPFGDSVVSVGEGFHLFPLKKDRGKSENLSTSADLTDCQPEFGLTRSRSNRTSFPNWVRHKAGEGAHERNARPEFSLSSNVLIKFSRKWDSRSQVLTNNERIVTELDSAGRWRVRGFAFVLGATFLPAYAENESVGLRRAQRAAEVLSFQTSRSLPSLTSLTSSFH